MNIQDIQLRMQIYEAINKYIMELMTSNNVPAAMISDAMNRVLVNVKDQEIVDLFIAASPQQEEEVDGD